MDFNTELKVPMDLTGKTYRTATTAILIAGIAYIALSCAKKPAPEAILGEWVGDSKTMMSDDKFKSKTNRPRAADMAARMLDALTMIITKDTVTAQVDKNKVSTRYSVISSTDNSVIVEILDGPRKGTRTTITITDRNHLSINEEGNPGTLFIKRK